MQALANLFLVVDEETGMVKYFETGVGIIVFTICICALLTGFYIIKSAVTTNRSM